MTMNITIDKIDVYFAVTLILLAIQVYHRYEISRLKRELVNTWTQINTIVTVVSAKIISLEKDIQSKVGEKESK